MADDDIDDGEPTSEAGTFAATTPRAAPTPSPPTPSSASSAAAPSSDLDARVRAEDEMAALARKMRLDHMSPKRSQWEARYRELHAFVHDTAATPEVAETASVEAVAMIPRLEQFPELTIDPERAPDRWDAPLWGRFYQEAAPIGPPMVKAVTRLQTAVANARNHAVKGHIPTYEQARQRIDPASAAFANRVIAYGDLIAPKAFADLERYQLLNDPGIANVLRDIGRLLFDGSPAGMDRLRRADAHYRKNRSEP